MCENCKLIYEHLPPELHAAMAAVKPMWQAAEEVAVAHIEGLFRTSIVDADTGQVMPVPEEHAKEYKRYIHDVHGVMGMAYTLGWIMAMKADSSEEMMALIGPAQEMLNKGLNEGNATRNTERNGGAHDNQNNVGFRPN